MEEEDASPGLYALIEDVAPKEAGHRLGIPGAHPPGLAFWAAALRETFEETGVLLEPDPRRCRSIPLGPESEEGRLREDLHQGRTSFRAVLEALGATLGGKRVVYAGHWVTPVQEGYRYDTRFFAAEVPADCPVFPDGVELVEALWVTPAEASVLNRAGELPMVFPTIRTLQALEPFESPREALEALGRREFPRLLPRVEETEEGVRFILEGPGRLLP